MHPLPAVSCTPSSRFLHPLPARLCCPAVTCTDPAQGSNRLGSVVYHDLRGAWHLPGSLGTTLAVGVNNVLDKDPPVCVTCL